MSQAIEHEGEKFPEARWLMTHPGVGPLTALAFVFIIGRADRFQCGKQIASYLGLVPLEDSSGTRRRLGHITKQGSSMLGFLMVEASQVTVRSLPEWRSKYFHLMMRRGRKIAKLFGWVPLLQFHQVLAHGLVHLRRLRKLLARDSAPFVGIGLDETAIDRQVVPVHQSDFQTACHDLLKQLLEQLDSWNLPCRFFENVE